MRGLLGRTLRFTACCSLFALLFVAGCGPSKVRVDESPKLGEYRVQSVVILPFEALPTPQSTDTSGADLYVPPGMARSSISLAIPLEAERLNNPTATVPAYAPEKVTRFVYGRLRKWAGLRVIAPGEAADAIKAAQAGSGSLEEVGKRVAQRLQADAALVGRVLIYRERGGSKIGGDPATVGFELKLVAADGTTLWVGNYYEKQKPMIEDLLGFWQRGGVFVTADELARYGVDHVLEKFPFGAPPARYEPEGLS
ncbi:hypothetical protein [Nitrospira sp. Kam-Ns4a]